MDYIGAKIQTILELRLVKDSFTGDGSTTTFDLANICTSRWREWLQVFIDNVRQEQVQEKHIH